jgi:hypothetical protein
MEGEQKELLNVVVGTKRELNRMGQKGGTKDNPFVPVNTVQ